MKDESHRVRAILECPGGHRHELCVTVDRGVPPELRCDAGQGTGYGPGGGGGCTVPPDLPARVERELRDGLQEAKRRGFVLVRA
jgi:hypothetical protein